MLTNNINTLPPQEIPICLIILEAYHAHTPDFGPKQAQTSLFLSQQHYPQFYRVSPSWKAFCQGVTS